MLKKDLDCFFYNKSINKQYAKHNPCPNASLGSFNNISNLSIDI